jgi:dTDP-4-amino-4,6-dideoxygalactose transaminase
VSAKKTIKFLSLKHQQDLIKTEVENAFIDTFEKSNYILGPGLRNFEQKFAVYCESKFCVGVGSGLDALTICLKSLDLKPDDEVIVPANTYHATWLAVANIGAKIIPVEPDEKTFNLDVNKVGDSISKKTKAILPVHLYGQACNMTELERIAGENAVKIVEDNAQAHGGRWKNKKTGSWGLMNATSFYPTKNLGALGDGGAITTNDEQLAEFARTYRNYGSSIKNYADEQGGNSRLDEMQAAFLSIKLNHLDLWNNQRRALAEKYNDRLKEIKEIVVPWSDANAFHVYHLYVIQAKRRNELQSYLHENGIETMVHYPVPPHLQKAYHKLGFETGKYPITERLVSAVLSLPLWPGIADEEVDYVTEVIKRFYN